jgi:hypothetical protein
VEVSSDQLLVLATAEPPLTLPRDGLLFFFGAECHDCWSFAGAVQLASERLEGFEVAGVSFSDPQALEEFRETFGATYPIHHLDDPKFRRISKTVPLAVWIEGGQIAGAWNGHVPSHRELAELGGYEIVEGPLQSRETPTVGGDGPSGSGSVGLFGGTVGARHR